MQQIGRIKGTRLTALRFSQRDNGGKKVMWFKCDCGNEKRIRMDHVQCGNTKSCGCMGIEHQSDHEHLRRMRSMPKRLENLKKYYETNVPANTGKIRIEEPIGSGKFKYVTEDELFSMYYGVEVA